MWVIAEIIERLSGESFTDYVRTHIAEPLNLPDLYVGCPEDQHHRIAEISHVGKPMTSEDYAKERGTIGEDIHEGKRTLMVLHTCDEKNTLVSQAEKERLQEILDMQTLDETLIREAIDILHKSGSIEYGI